MNSEYKRPPAIIDDRQKYSNLIPSSHFCMKLLGRSSGRSALHPCHPFHSPPPIGQTQLSRRRLDLSPAYSSSFCLLSRLSTSDVALPPDLIYFHHTTLFSPSDIETRCPPLRQHRKSQPRRRKIRCLKLVRAEQNRRRKAVGSDSSHNCLVYCAGPESKPS